MPATQVSTRSVILNLQNSPHAKLQNVPIDAVQLRDSFWQPRRDINLLQTLSSQYKHMKDTNRLRNMARAAGLVDADFDGIYFNDSDVYKWLEALCWTLAEESRAQPGTPEASAYVALRAMVDEVAGLIEAMQGDDGYLHSYFVLDKAEERFTWLENSHELYCFGHFMQAAVAHHRVTGEARLLNVAKRLGDFLDKTFGPADEGKIENTDGHQEIEMALVELARETGEDRYLKLAQFFVEVRKPGVPIANPHFPALGSRYDQSHEPLREQSEAVGHAVRAVYFYCAATDLVTETDDEQLRAAMERLWQNVTRRKMYISGGIGARHGSEAFGDDYELPNATSYCETCAAIGLVMWSWRLLQLTGEARFADILERALYNAVLPGLSLSGDRYFYDNPLESDGSKARQEWFGCACCPPNIARLLAQLPGYFCSIGDNEVWLHLYAQSTLKIAMQTGAATLDVSTQYPWNGDVEIRVAETTSDEWTLFLRVPAWCAESDAQPQLLINGETWNGELTPENYVAIRRVWQNDDCVQLQLPMQPRRVACHPKVAENRGRVALLNGPLLYCIEDCDHDQNVAALAISRDASLDVEWKKELLNGVNVLKTEGHFLPDLANWDEALYRPAKTGATQKVAITAIPYYAWGNREKGAMRVWLPQM
jgi:uncharacterized protein